MIRLQEQNQLFALIGEKLRRKIECYVIGGSAMMYYGMKDVTKDVDLVFSKEDERGEVICLLRELGYSERGIKVEVIYAKKKNVPVLLQREETRIDLFFEKIITTKLTDTMKGRVTQVYEFDKLTVKVVAPEDIIFLKCATERAGDRLDAVEILKRVSVNWEIVLQESLLQSRIGEHLFPVYLFDFLYELKEDLKADIPKNVLDEVRKIAEDLLEEKLGKKNKGVKEKKQASKKKRKVH